MKQLYEVGEVVILQCKSHPHYNGQHIIHKVLTFGGLHQCRLTGTLLEESDSLGYVLEDLLADEETSMEIFWCESALRKKHQPGEQSFKDLMTTLKSPQKVEWD